MQSSQLVIVLLAVALIVCVVIIAYLISTIVKLKTPESMKQEQPRPERVIHVAGNYIAEMTINNDIHDNHNCPIYAVPGASPQRNGEGSVPFRQEGKSDNQPSAESILGIPAERDYKAVRIYIEERSRFDSDFKTFCEANSRVAICQRLSKEFGWTVDPYGLGRNINRKRKKKA